MQSKWDLYAIVFFNPLSAGVTDRQTIRNNYGVLGLPQSSKLEMKYGIVFRVRDIGTKYGILYEAIKNPER